MKEELLDENEAATLCGLETKYFRNLRRTAHGPKYVRPSPHVTLYRKSDVEAWRDSWLCTGAPDQCQGNSEIGDD